MTPVFFFLHLMRRLSLVIDTFYYPIFYYICINLHTVDNFFNLLKIKHYKLRISVDNPSVGLPGGKIKEEDIGVIDALCCC